MIHINSLKKQYAHKVLFENLSLHIKKNDRIALVGENGTGKSTLLKIIAKLEDYDSGEINYVGNVKVEYLPQFLFTKYDDITLFEEVSKVFSDIYELEKKLKKLEEKMGEVDYDSPEYEKIMNKYGNIQDKLDEMNYYETETKIRRILKGLGFSEEDFDKKCSVFSGGWQMRIFLAKILLSEPDVLLLDEPTNHLDIEARNWLEDFIKNFKGAVVLVSHDRYFLDATVNKVAEIYAGVLRTYPGNYSHFEKAREEYIESLHEKAKQYEEQVEKMEKFISKFRYKATKASQVQSRIKMLEKLEKPIIPPKRKKINFEFKFGKPSGLKVMEAKEISKQYGENVLFMDVNFKLERGEKIAILGKNGTGKTTLMKIISGIVEPDIGEIILGHNVVLNYYAQEPSEILDEEKTVYEIIYEEADYEQGADVRNILGAFLFSDDDVYKKVKVLSGGERSRLALARMLLKPSNFLLLDEPTNHLDIYSKDVLLDALKKYEGTVVFVSHDRYFIDNLAEKIIYLKDGRVINFNGNYEDFVKKYEDVFQK